MQITFKSNKGHGLTKPQSEIMITFARKRRSVSNVVSRPALLAAQEKLPNGGFFFANHPIILQPYGFR